MKEIITKNIDRLRLGDVTCVIRDKITGKERTAEGTVARVPYKKDASAEVRKKYGKNLVYVIYRDTEDIVQYRQPAKTKTNVKQTGKIKTIKKSK